MSQAMQQLETGTKPIVLFLDDNLQVLRMYESYFREKGYEVLTSSHGEKAIEIAEAHAVRVAVVDYEMPEMNGHQAALALKRVRPTLPVIMVSGSGTIPPEAWKAVDFFVSKSAGQRHLSEIVDAFARR